LKGINERHPCSLCGGGNTRLNLIKGGRSVALWLTLAEKVEARAVEQQDFVASRMCARAR
jgi:hypothetical protein